MDSIKLRASSSYNEEDLKLGVAPLLDQIAGKLGLEGARYEKQVGSRSILFRGRLDALYGRFILEYKSPGLLDHSLERTSAIQQVKDYITTKSQSEGLQKSLYFSAVLDGRKVLFVQFSGVENKWRVRGPFPINKESVGTLIEAIRGLSRKALDGNEIIKDLGPMSEVAKEVISLLYETDLRSERSNVLYEEWYRTFIQVVSYTPSKLKELRQTYEVRVENENQGRKLLYSIQTYFALVMKLITAEVLQLYSGGRMMRSFLLELDDARIHGLLINKLRFIEEEGGFFQQITGIENFLEGNFFSWYVNEWSPEIEKSITKVIQVLSNYEPSTADLEPERIKDLFKVLYQDLLPKKLRHSFGEYYTPDWLASLILHETGINVDPDLLSKKVLDPACGSGTFLISVIKQIRLLCEEHNFDTHEVFNKIITNVVGYDLNPLAILASRANYVIALGQLLSTHSGRFDIPVYLCDSVGLRVTNMIEHPNVPVYELNTSVGVFKIPAKLPQSPIFKDIINEIGTHLSARNDTKLFRESFENSHSDLHDISESVVSLYQDLLKLERDGKDKIWLGILRNTFAPLLKGEFDYVIGNPPWINWESLPESYRIASKPVWQEYDLVQSVGQRRRGGMGTAKKDVSMLFIAVSSKKYLKSNGKLGMLCPYTLFKVTAGNEFREFLSKVSVEKIIDLVETLPFEGATTRTAAIILSRTGKTSFPIPCDMWRPNESISGKDSYSDVREKCSTFNFRWYPSNTNSLNEPWLMVTENAYKGLKKSMGEGAYKAHAGVFTGLNGVYWVEIIEQNDKEAYVKNLYDVGKTKVTEVQGWVEKDLIYPLIRGRDLTPWENKPSAHIILPVDSSGDTLPEEKLRSTHPKAYIYFEKFRDILLKRNAQPYKSWFGGKRKSAPFYALFNASAGFGKYKVAWQYISGKISGKAKFNVGLIEPNAKTPIIPNEKLMLISTNIADEAFFITGVLSSTISKLLVASYAIESHIAPDIMYRIGIPRFDKGDNKHTKIVEITKKLKEKAISSKTEGENNELWKTLDNAVAQLYGIEEDELGEIRDDFSVLLDTSGGEEIEDDEEEEQPVGE